MTARRARQEIGVLVEPQAVTSEGLLHLKQGLTMEVHRGRKVSGEENFYATAELKLVITAASTTYYDAIQEALDNLAEALSQAQRETA